MSPQQAQAIAKTIVNLRLSSALAGYRGFDPKWLRIARLTGEHDSTGRIIVSARSLVDLGVLYDVSGVALTPNGIYRCLRSRCPVPNLHWDKFVRLFEIDDLAPLSRTLADIAVVCPEPVRLALEGRLNPAVDAIPRQGLYLNCKFSPPEWLRSTIVSIARYNALAGLLDAGDEAFVRLYEPTGHDLLDHQPGRRASILKVAGSNLITEEARVVPLALTFTRCQTRAATAQEVAALAGEPIQPDARSLQQYLETTYAADAPLIVRHLYLEANVLASRTMAQVRTAVPRLPHNLTTYKARRTKPLERLWLACAAAAAWVERHNRDKCPLEQALDAIAAGKPIVRPRVRKKTDRKTRELFFLMRHLFARDPRAVLPGVTDMAKVAAATEALWQPQAKLPLWKLPFDTDQIRHANAALRAAEKANDDVYLAEARGLLWLQLRLA